YNSCSAISASAPAPVSQPFVPERQRFRSIWHKPDDRVTDRMTYGVYRRSAPQSTDEASTWRGFVMRLTPIIGALACLGLASAAAAADLGGSLKDGPILAAHPNWSGLYIGGHVGWATGEWDGTLTYDKGNGPVPNIWDNHNQTLDDDGWIGGVQVGFNLQNASFVYGIEADASWADFGGRGSFTAMAGEPTWHVNQDLDAFGTVRARLGFLVTPRLMI